MKFLSNSNATRLPALLLIGAFTVTNALADQVSIDSRDFIPIFGTTPYAESSAGNLTCSGANSGNLFIAQVPLPPAPAELDLKQIAMWGGDFASVDSQVRLDRYCQSEFSASIPAQTNLATLSSSGNSGNYFDASTLNFRVSDQQSCVYMVVVRIGLNGCVDNTLSVARVRVRYDLVQAPVVDAIFKNGFEN